MHVDTGLVIEYSQLYIHLCCCCHSGV